MKILVTGDFHIPERSFKIPDEFVKIIVLDSSSFSNKKKFDKVICLGNISASFESIKFLYNLSDSFHIVKGGFDNLNILSKNLQILATESVNTIKLTDVITVNNFKIGFTNGYHLIPRNDKLALSALANELDVDILIWGGTHIFEAYTFNKVFFINPGSMTGSFLLDTSNAKINVQSLKLIHNKNEEKLESNIHSVVEKQHQETDTHRVNNTYNDKKAYFQFLSQKGIHINPDIDYKKTMDSVLKIPSFCLLEIENQTCNLYIYRFICEEIKVDKIIYLKT